MVTLHARAAGLDPIRTTKDVDTLLDVAVTSVNRADDLLRGLGYRFLPSIDESAPAHRWVREADGAQVDILVPDHLARPPRFARRSTVAAPGATSVLTRHRTRAIIDGPRPVRLGPVSYTHLDVYKRQGPGRGDAPAGPSGRAASREHRSAGCPPGRTR